MDIHRLLNPEPDPREKHLTRKSPEASDGMQDSDNGLLEAENKPESASGSIVELDGTSIELAYTADAAYSGTSIASSGSPTLTLPSIRTASPAVSSSSSNSVEENPRSWTLREYHILSNLRSRGFGWDQISQCLPGRSPGACFDRSKSTRLIAGNAHPHWVAEEEKLLVTLKNKGFGWPEIADHLPARTPDGCKNRWYEKFHQPPRRQVLRHKDIFQSELSGTFSNPARPDCLESTHVPGATSQAHDTTATNQNAMPHLRLLAPKPPSNAESFQMDAYPYGQEFRHYLELDHHISDKTRLQPHLFPPTPRDW